MLVLGGMVRSAVAIDLDVQQWELINYRKIKANTVTNVNDHMLINVDQSSSALVYPFATAKTVKGIKIRAQMQGDLNYQDMVPGSMGADDFPLRIGLIEQGSKKLNFLQKAMAPQWLKTLNAFSANYGGLNQVYSLLFYTQSPDFEKREHPLAKYFFEVALAQFKNGKLEYSHQFEQPTQNIGLWISSDGDDTLSSYSIRIHALQLIE
ncbi:MAG TPA: hypothetical protein PKC21_07630 [Oligoflexia bacterium]|nr:hypothetical protein [Oligoflexia bacterium]